MLFRSGALGDFLQSWPSLCALVKHWPDKEFLWAGRFDRQLWTSPLGFHACPPDIRHAVESIPSAQTWPEELEKTVVLWFGLQKSPSDLDFSRLLFLPGIRAGDSTPPRERYAQGLEQAGIRQFPGWIAEWRKLFGLAGPSSDNRTTVLLFPGAGHPLRCWPLDRFHKLADWLSRQGLNPCFILGPAEMDRGIRVQDFEHCVFWDLEALQTKLLQARMVVGNDTGPLHLAGYLGIPVVSLFGPSSPAQWAPLGAKVITLDKACSPCSQTGRVLCRNPLCMTEIECSTVQQAVLELLVQRA